MISIGSLISFYKENAMFKRPLNNNLKPESRLETFLKINTYSSGRNQERLLRRHLAAKIKNSAQHLKTTFFKFFEILFYIIMSPYWALYYYRKLIKLVLYSFGP